MSNVNWIKLNKVGQLDEIKKLSNEKPVVIFKHSIKCPISAMALNRLERSWNPSEHKETSIYYLDLINYREVSNAIADVFDVHHQSPQVIIVKNEKAVYDDSHMGISYEDITTNLNGLVA